MDDILSAVDTHTSQFIFDKCLQGDLLRGRTIVLVTHHVGLCFHGADFVVSVKEGRVDQAYRTREAGTSELITLSPSIPEELAESPMTTKTFGEPEQDNQVSRHVYQAEVSSMGRVASSHYWMVFSAAGGIRYWLVLAFLAGGASAFGNVGMPVWLRHWLSDLDPRHLDYNLAVYALISSGGIIFNAMRWVWLYGVGNLGFYNRGSKKIHATLLHRVCGAPLSFFESTPAGRVMNIFAQDVNRMDSSIADDFGRESSAGVCSLSCLFAAITISGTAMAGV